VQTQTKRRRWQSYLYPSAPLSLLLLKQICIPGILPLSRATPLPHRTRPKARYRFASLPHPVASCVPSLSAIRRFPNPPSSTERDLLSPCPRPILFSTESCRGAFGIERGGINAAGPRAGRHRRAHAGCSLSRGGLSR
jgi:hypothetical protein